MDVESQPETCTLFHCFTTNSNLYTQRLHIPAFGSSDSKSNLNFPAKAVNYYSRQQLLAFRSRFSVSRKLFLTLKDLGILKTRRVRAGMVVKDRSGRIPVIPGTRRIQNLLSPCAL